MKKGDVHSGFKVLSVKSFIPYNFFSTRLVHRQTGAEVYHIHNDDNENFFSFVFKTPPENDLGAPHVLEHVILRGSEHFPLKTPFTYLLNGSLCTGFNALTFPDKTVFYAGSINKNDFYNLLTVYGDAVFFPLLKKESFLEECCYFDRDDPGNPGNALKIRGVVYNELKGDMLNINKLIEKYIITSLFTGTPYQFAAAGTPGGIPGLSYEMIRDYYHKYYHPSNLKIFLYGNIPTGEHLAFLENNFLKEFDSSRKIFSINQPGKINSPLYVSGTFPVNKENVHDNKEQAIISWLFPVPHNAYNIAVYTLLGEILAGSNNALLTKALLESGLGEDISANRGLETELSSLVFSIGLKGIAPGQSGIMESVVSRVLENTAREGIAGSLFDIALNRVLFNTIERENGNESYALYLLRNILKVWLYGFNPDSIFSIPSILEHFLRNKQRTMSLLRQIIGKQFIDNTHRVILVVKPDSNFLLKEKEKEKNRISSLENCPAGEFSGKIAAELSALQRYREENDKECDINRIPFLELTAIDKAIRETGITEYYRCRGIPFYFNSLAANDLVYLDIAFNTKNLDPSLIRWLPLFARVLCRSGIKGRSYTAYQQQLSVSIGRLFGDLEAVHLSHNISPVENFFLRLAFLKENTGQALALAGDLLLNPNLSDHAGILNHCIGLKNECIRGLSTGMHHFAFLRAKQKFNPCYEKEEFLKGITQYRFLTGLAADWKNSCDKASAYLQRIHESLVIKSNIAVNITCLQPVLENVKDHLVSMLLPVPDRTSAMPGTDLSPGNFTPVPGREAFVIPAASGSVIKILRPLPAGNTQDVCRSVLAQLLTGSYLHEKIRAMGGAYGAFAFNRDFENYFGLVSYSDSNILETLALFRQALEHMSLQKIDKSAAEKAVITTLAREDAPVSVQEKSFADFKGKLYGITSQIRQKRRDILLNISPDQLRATALVLLSAFDEGYTCAFADKSTILQARLKDRKKIFNPEIIELPF